MRNRLRFLGMLYIAALFGCGLVVSTKIFNPKNTIVYFEKTEEKVAPTFSKNVFCILHFSQNTHYAASNLAIFKIKNPLHIGVSIDKIPEAVLQIKLSQYLSFSKNFLIRQRKTNIIFPFHSHW